MNTYLKRGLGIKEISPEFKAGLVIYRCNVLEDYPTEKEITGYLEDIVSEERAKKAIETLMDWSIAKVHGLREVGERRDWEYEINSQNAGAFKEMDRIAKSIYFENSGGCS